MDISPQRYGNLATRLRNSPEPRDRRNIILGIGPNAAPVLHDEKLIPEGIHLLGAPGTGKSKLLKTMATQLIARSSGDFTLGGRPPGPNDMFHPGPLFMVDMMPDQSLYWHLRQLAEEYGRTFRYFVVEAGLSSHVYNLFLNDLSGLTISQLANMLHQSLGLLSGLGYGESYYAQSTEKMAYEVLRYGFTGKLPERRSKRPKNVRRNAQTPILSFTDLYRATLDIMEADPSLTKDGDHFSKIISSLANAGPSLNLSPRDNPGHPALATRIDLKRAIEERHVVYFGLPGETPLISGIIARLFLYHLRYTVRRWRRENPRANPLIPVLTDESHLIAAGNIVGLVDQLRKLGVGLVFSHQAMSQLTQSRGPDLESLMMETTATKVYFSVRDPRTMKRLIDASGTVAYHDLSSWDIHCSDYLRGLTHPAWAAPRSTKEPEPVVRMNQSMGPRLTTEDIVRISREPNQAILMVSRIEGHSRYEAAIPIYTPPMQTLEDYLACLDAPWPNDEGTVLIPDETTIDIERFFRAGQRSDDPDLGEIQRRNDSLFDNLDEDDVA